MFSDPFLKAFVFQPKLRFSDLIFPCFWNAAIILEAEPLETWNYYVIFVIEVPAIWVPAIPPF